MTVTAEPPVVIPLAGPLTIATAAATRATLLAGLKTARDIHVDCAAGTRFDVGFVQLLVAAQRQAALQGGTLTLSPNHPAPLGDILAEGGFAGWPATAPGDAP